MARFTSLLFVLFFASACWATEVDKAAQATQLIDEQFAALYTEVAAICTRKSADWAEYDTCIEPWNREAANVARLREVTLSLDVVHGRAAKKAAACEWFQAVHNVYNVPARRVALASKWRRKC